MTTARERAEAMAREAATVFLDEYGLPEVYDAGVMLKKTTEHFLKHADRARNEALEEAAKWHDLQAEKMRAETKPDHLMMRCGVVGHLADAAALRAMKEPT